MKIKTFKIGDIEVYKNDLDGVYNYYEALSELEVLGNGWRLPTKFEFYYLAELHHEFNICNFGKKEWYWCTKENSTRVVYRISVINKNVYPYYLREESDEGKLESSILNVRPVRNI